MYRKRNRKPLIVTVIIMMLVLAAMIGLQYYKKLQELESAVQETETGETETEISTHDVLLYKTGDGEIEFESRWLKKDTDSESILEIEADTLVTLLVTPKPGRILESVDIVDYEFNEINHFLRTASADEIRVNFVMPDTDVIINFNFTAQEAEQVQTELLQTEVETEAQTEGNPYGLTLNGVTADIIVSYNGQFDDRDFLQQLGDALHMDSARSEYRNVTDVTFSTEVYAGAKDSDKVYYYIYFNGDPSWKVLSTYYLNEHSYVFTEPAAETEASTEPEVQAQGSTGTAQVSSGQTSYSTGSSTTSGGSTIQYAPATTVTTTTTFDILQVSKTFLAYVGDTDRFYDKTWKYVLSEGLTGNIVGTLSSYRIDTEKKKATFTITLNTGDTIKGNYNKKKDKYTFKGL